MTNQFQQPILRVLFVDDDASILAGLRRTMRQCRNEWKMSFVNGGAEALEHIRNQPVDLVVSDVRMPRIDGAQLLNEIATEFPHIIRFVLSGQAEKEKVLSLVGTAHQYFAKPCNAERLFNSVKAIRIARQQLNHAGLANLIPGICVVPSSPRLHAQLGIVLESGRVRFDEVKRIVRADIGLSTKVLQLVSSSFFGTPLGSCQIDQACDVLGLELLRELYFQSSAFVPLTESAALRIPAASANPLLDCGQRLHGLLQATCDDFESTNLPSPVRGAERGEVAEPDWESAASYLFTLWGIEISKQANRGECQTESTAETEVFPRVDDIAMDSSSASSEGAT